MGTITWSESPNDDGAAALSMASSVELLRRARSGDDEALNRLCERYLPQMKRWARGRLPRWARDLLNTDDLVQETMLQTVRNVERFVPRHDNAFKIYLRQGLFNRIRDEVRRAGRQPAEAAPANGFRDSPHPGPSPLEEVIGEECLRRYRQALRGMREVDREAIVARIQDGLGYREIAELLGKPSADAARMAVARALVTLARRMKR